MKRITKLTSVLVVTLLYSAGIADAQRIGRIQQGLISDVVVTREVQEEYGLLTLNNSCSASLLRNNWAITAAHCVDRPDPANPGAFILDPDNSATLTANWNSVQVRRSIRIISFRPMDVALIRVDSPF